MKVLVGTYAVPCSCGSDEWNPLDQIRAADSLSELLCAQCGNVQLEADLVLQAPITPGVPTPGRPVSSH